MAVDEVIAKYRGRVIWQYIPKKRKCFRIKFYKLCDEAGYTCAMRVYLGKDLQSATETWLQHMQQLDIWPTELKA